MPIKGLTTETQAGAGLPLIARLYKGAEKEVRTNRQGKEYEVVGKDLDYFRVEFEPQFEYLRELWTEMYGEQPTEFAPVFLAASTVDDAFQSWKEEWNASGTLLHRCDGEQQVAWWNGDSQCYMSARVGCASRLDPKTGEMMGAGCGCKPVGRLNIILPDFIQESGIFGTILVSTHSLNDIMIVHRYLSDIEGAYGTISGVPFIFGRAKKEVSAPKQVKQGNEYVRDGRIKVMKSLFYLHVAPDFTRERLLPAMAGRTQPALPPPAPQINVERAKELLGGGGSRRMGDEPPPASVQDEDAWAFDRDQLIAAVGRIHKAPSQERYRTVVKMAEEGAFADCKTMDEAIPLVLARLDNHRQPTPSPDEDDLDGFPDIGAPVTENPFLKGRVRP